MNKGKGVDVSRIDNLIINEDVKTPIGEAYRTIRTNIQFSMPKGQLRTMLITSTGPEEGKSTTTANLAITMAESGNRVLLIDADLRKSVVHKMFQLPNLKGLTNVLAEDLDYREILRSTKVKGLDILTGGPKPPNPSELLGSEKMRTFLESLKKDYDIIILDTPPVLPVTDAAILASQVDGVVIVSSYGHTTFDGLDRAKVQLENVDAKILGVILNKVPTSKRSGHYYYYYYYDGYSSPGKSE
jgi:capsular exopolysaccharide synthesis family protein